MSNATPLAERPRRPTLVGRRVRPRIDLRIHVRAHDLAEFVAQQAPNVDGDRIFIFTGAPLPVGASLRFSLHLPTGEPMLDGRGVVQRVQHAEPSGMEVLFVATDEHSRRVHDLLRAQSASDPQPAAPPPPTEDCVPVAVDMAHEISRRVNAAMIESPPEPIAPVAAPRIADALFDDALTELAPESHAVPVNPFDGVSQGAIDYFVEWSISSATDATPARALPAPEPIAAPDTQVSAPPRRRWPVLLGFAAGMALGVLLPSLDRPAPPNPSRPLVALPAPVPETMPISTDPPPRLAKAAPPRATEPPFQERKKRWRHHRSSKRQ